MEIFLGLNLNSARHSAEGLWRECPEGGLLFLDGREGRNPAARRAGVPDGVYIITRQEGRAPGTVRYYGRQISWPMEEAS